LGRAGQRQASHWLAGSLEKLTADIPPGTGDPKILHQRFTEKADRILSRWKEDNKNLLQRLKALFSGDGEEATKVLEKLFEKAVSGEVTAVGGGTASGC
jgi:hypothetical protein